MKFFADNSLGLKANLERHNKRQEQLMASIQKILDEPSEFDDVLLVSYRNMLDLLLASKAELVSKIGRKSA
jgi:hypothetical protein